VHIVRSHFMHQVVNENRWLEGWSEVVGGVKRTFP